MGYISGGFSHGFLTQVRGIKLLVNLTQIVCNLSPKRVCRTRFMEILFDHFFGIHAFSLGMRGLTQKGVLPFWFHMPMARCLQSFISW